MLYSCTHIATACVKGLKTDLGTLEDGWDKEERTLSLRLKRLVL